MASKPGSRRGLLGIGHLLRRAASRFALTSRPGFIAATLSLLLLATLLAGIAERSEMVAPLQPLSAAQIPASMAAIQPETAEQPPPTPEPSTDAARGPSVGTYLPTPRAGGEPMGRSPTPQTSRGGQRSVQADPQSQSATPQDTPGTTTPEASDGSTLRDQPQDVQDLFARAYGNEAPRVWAEQHSHDLANQAGAHAPNPQPPAEPTSTPTLTTASTPEPTSTSESASEPTSTSESASTPEPTSTPTPTLASTPAPQPSVAQVPSSTPQAAPKEATGSPVRVGIQAGHWKSEELPAELSSLRTSTGAAGAGWREVDINLGIARRVVAILSQKGIQADLLPATVPPGYKADAFVALHGDANGNAAVSGYKVARATQSRIPEKDDALLRDLSAEYQTATGLKEHPQSITQNMLQYYAFDNRHLEHAVDPTTPAVILEMGFLTNPSDRTFLMEQPDRAAEGIATGILRFLDGREG